MASMASGFARLLSEFRFFFCVCLALHVLCLTILQLCAVQAQPQSLSDNLTVVDSLQAAVTDNETASTSSRRLPSLKRRRWA